MTWDIACLCAAWCRTCESYRPVFERIAAERPPEGRVCRWHWVDIEGEADLLGDLDVETFPTLVLVGPSGVKFAGPVEAREETLRALLRRALADQGGAEFRADHPMGLAGLVEGLRQRPPSL
ncbi:thioredoxin domain-containing protein [Methylibium sp.]|uniref:thioredoxin domain-containing protein n=1 Tax=Methylibium sp. TaxID=2067992 RepID=UPI003D1352D6